MQIRRHKSRVAIKVEAATRHVSDHASFPASFEVVGDPDAVSDAFIDALARMLLDAVERVSRAQAENEQEDV